MPKLLRMVLALSLASTLHFSTNAQSLSINNTGAVANASSILDVSSTSKGVLIPRMTKVQKNAIAAPATGLLIYQTATDSIGFHYYNGTKWTYLAIGYADSSSWKITGNANITSLNFLGTTNDSALNFRIRNQPSGIIDYSFQNTAIGYNALSGNSTGTSNTAMGYNALSGNLTGTGNTAIGYNSTNALDIGMNNTSLGANSGLGYSSGTGNTSIGVGAFSSANSSNYMALGFGAGGTWSSANNTIELGNFFVTNIHYCLPI